jgi:hypothetical protein
LPQLAVAAVAGPILGIDRSSSGFEEAAAADRLERESVRTTFSAMARKQGFPTIAKWRRAIS